MDVRKPIVAAVFVAAGMYIRRRDVAGERGGLE